MIGGLAYPGDSGDKQDRCYVFGGVITSKLVPEERKNALIFITNPSGRWTDADLHAVYLMPGETRLSSREAMQEIRGDIDGVRERALPRTL